MGFCNICPPKVIMEQKTDTPGRVPVTVTDEVEKIRQSLFL